MAWLKIDDRVRTHPKIVTAGPAAAWFWFCAVCYCREHLTDGFISMGMIPTLAPGVSNGRALAKKLVAVHLFHEADNGYLIHDFLDWNPSKAQVLQQRAEDLKRKRNPSGFQPESTTDSIPDSNRTPQGIRTDASRDHARTRGLGSGSTEALGLGLSEGGAGETRLRGGALITSPLAFDRIHGKHVTGFCDFVCLPRFLFDDFANRVVSAGAAPAEAEAQVLAWAAGVRDEWAGRIPGDDSLAFWRHRWQETHGSSKPSTGPSGDGLRGLREAVKHG